MSLAHLGYVVVTVAWLLFCYYVYFRLGPLSMDTPANRKPRRDVQSRRPEKPDSSQKVTPNEVHNCLVCWFSEPDFAIHLFIIMLDIVGMKFSSTSMQFV